MTVAMQATEPQAKREQVARVFCLLTALFGVVVTAIPTMFHLEPYYVPLVLVGSGVAVIALAVFLYFSI